MVVFQRFFKDISQSVHRVFHFRGKNSFYILRGVLSHGDRNTYFVLLFFSSWCAPACLLSKVAKSFLNCCEKGLVVSRRSSSTFSLQTPLDMRRFWYLSCRILSSCCCKRVRSWCADVAETPVKFVRVRSWRPLCYHHHRLVLVVVSCRFFMTILRLVDIIGFLTIVDQGYRQNVSQVILCQTVFQNNTLRCGTACVSFPWCSVPIQYDPWRVASTTVCFWLHARRTSKVILVPYHCFVVSRSKVHLCLTSYVHGRSVMESLGLLPLNVTRGKPHLQNIFQSSISNRPGNALSRKMTAVELSFPC